MNQKEVKEMLRAFECDCGEVIIKDKPQSKALCPKCRHYVKTYVDFKDREEYLDFKEILEDLQDLKDIEAFKKELEEREIEELENIGVEDTEELYPEEFLVSASRAATLPSPLFEPFAKEFYPRRVGLDFTPKKGNGFVLDFKGYGFVADFDYFKLTYEEEIVKRAVTGKKLNVNTWHILKDEQDQGRGYLHLIEGEKYVSIMVPYIEAFNEDIRRFKESRMIQNHRIFTDSQLESSDKRARRDMYAYVLPDNPVQLGFFLNKYAKYLCAERRKPAQDEELEEAKTKPVNKSLADLEYEYEFRLERIWTTIQDLLEIPSSMLHGIKLKHGMRWLETGEYPLLIEDQILEVESDFNKIFGDYTNLEILKDLLNIRNNFLHLYGEDFETLQERKDHLLTEGTSYTVYHGDVPSRWKMVDKEDAIEGLPLEMMIGGKKVKNYVSPSGREQVRQLIPEDEYRAMCAHIQEEERISIPSSPSVISQLLHLDEEDFLQNLQTVFLTKEAKDTRKMMKALNTSSRMKEREALKAFDQKDDRGRQYNAVYALLVDENDNPSRISTREELGELLREQSKYLFFKASENVHMKEMEETYSTGYEDHTLYSQEIDDQEEDNGIDYEVPSTFDQLSRHDVNLLEESKNFEVCQNKKTKHIWINKMSIIENPFYDSRSRLMKKDIYFKGQNVFKDGFFKNKNILVGSGQRKMTKVTKAYAPTIIKHMLKDCEYIVTGGNGETDKLFETIALELGVKIIQCTPRAIRLNSHQRKILDAGGTILSFKSLKEKYQGAIDYQLRNELMAQIGSHAKKQGGNASALMIGAGTYSGTASTWYFCKEEGLSVETFASPILETNFQPQKVEVSKRNVEEENELKDIAKRIRLNTRLYFEVMPFIFFTSRYDIGINGEKIHQAYVSRSEFEYQYIFDYKATYHAVKVAHSDRVDRFEERQRALEAQKVRKVQWKINNVKHFLRTDPVRAEKILAKDPELRRRIEEEMFPSVNTNVDVDVDVDTSVDDVFDIIDNL